MKTYTINVTAEELRILSHALMTYEHAAVKSTQQYLIDENFCNTLSKVHTQLEQYYEDNGIGDDA